MLGTIWLTLNSFSGTVAKADQMIWQFKKQSFNFSSSLPILRFFSFYFQFFPGSPSQEVLDFGTMGMGEKRDIYFANLNKNPIAVTLRVWGANLTGSLLGWCPNLAMLQLSDFCLKLRKKCLASRPFPWYQNSKLLETEIPANILKS